jgi:SecD/SecF fusion protein
MQKGLVKFLAVALAVISLFYLSFTFVTSKYYKQAKEYAGDNTVLESHYLDSIALQKVWLGYTLKDCRSNEINLGLDLKGGMNVIMEIRPADVLRSLSDYNPDPVFNKALESATALQDQGKTDYITNFANQYKSLDPDAKLAAIFATYDLKEKITSKSTNEEVIKVLKEELKSSFDNSFNVLRTRIDRFGVVAPNIQQLEGDGRILIELPGVKEPERVRSLLQGTANLEFWETYWETDIHSTLYAINNIIRDSIQAAKSAAVAVPVTSETPQPADAVSETLNLLNDSSLTTQAEEKVTEQANDNTQIPFFAILGINPSQPYQSPVVGFVKRPDMLRVEQYLNNPKVKALLEMNKISLKWGVKPMKGKEDIYELYALKVHYFEGKQKPILNGDVVSSARDDFGQNSSSAQVSMSMNSEGAKEWARITKQNIGKSIAIVLDNQVYSAPRVNDEITGGHSSITGDFTSAEAKDLANVLKSGKMSAPAIIVSEDVIGPSLGQEAINMGFISFIIALIVLMSYLVVMYGFKPGMIANAALFFNLFFTLGVLVSFHAVLTLSGIAGIVLALALAVDANVLVYERIKEEVRGGKQVKKAVEEGYKKAFSAIFDSNLTSIITGVILFIFGTGPIRGFATTLIIGIIISFFTAVFLTRVTYESFMKRGKLLNLTFTTKVSKNFLVNPTFDILKHRKAIYASIIAIVIVCVGAFGVRGLNQGIDFTGGRNYVVRFSEDVNTADIQEKLAPYFENVPSVITIGKANQVRISTNYKINVNNENGVDVDKEITGKFDEALKDSNYEIVSSQKVGPSIADDIKRGAVWAVIFAVIAIGLYILLRFRDVSYSVGASVALAGDALFIIGAYSLFWGILPFSLEVDQTFIGAILTVIGYSINDKVVIFDRVREFTHLYPKRGKYELFNDALNTTLDRTFNTSFSTFLVLIIIFIFAGDAIRSFAFAMILGVFVGTLSSLYLAAPIAYEIQNKKQLKIKDIK